VKPGLVVDFATRELREGRKLEATQWCDAATGSSLDVIGAIHGVACSFEMQLPVPWTTRATRNRDR
jgi:hypothetical protein